MPSFDVVSEIDQHELTNAVDQANREVSNRFDFKGTDSRIEASDSILKLIAPTEFQVNQIQDILHNKMSKRGIDIRALDAGKIIESNNTAQQEITVRQGIDQALSKKMVKLIKDSRLKVQAGIQGDKIRVTGKKKDDLQAVISLLKEGDFDFPLQFVNFRD